MRPESGQGARRVTRNAPRGVLGTVLAAAVVVACGYDWTVIPTESSPARDAAAEVKGKGCTSNADCTSDELCAFPDRRCGAGVAGTCARRSASAKCSGGATVSVCTCDGRVMTSPCEASAQGLDLTTEDRCKFDSATSFRCGFALCSTKTFCLETGSGTTSDYTCSPWACTERSCACKETVTSCAGATCELLKGGGVVVRCE